MPSGKINWNRTFVKETIEKLEEDDDRSQVSSDYSEQQQKKRVADIVNKNIRLESGVDKVDSLLALNRLHMKESMTGTVRKVKIKAPLPQTRHSKSVPKLLSAAVATPTKKDVTDLSA